jgi:hypothetical protein
VIPKPSASCGAWIDDSSPSPHNWGGSLYPKNEETLAGQQAQSAPGDIDHLKITGGMGIYHHESAAGTIS